MDPLFLLALAGIPSLALVAVLAGVWLGFRISLRDAALLGRFANEAHAAHLLAEQTAGEQRALREEVSGVLESVERKRRSTAGAAAKVNAAFEAREAEAAVPPAPLTPRERRRLIGRRLHANGGL